MSQQQISRSGDLRQLRDEGYEVAILAGDLIVTHVPYIDSSKEVKYGTLVSELTLAGDITAQPNTHVVYFAGDQPCDAVGRPLSKLIVDGQPPHRVTDDLVAEYTFSSKPTPSGIYPDYYTKMTTYTSILGSEARVIDPDATAQTYRLVPDDDAEAVFNYLDTASSRAGISVITNKLAVPRVAIVGLGGTGSYILDLISKAPIREIHLFDGDLYLQHNAFRSPGAPSADELQQQLMKVAYFADKYSAMRRGIVPHPHRIDETNAVELDDMNFVFLAVDDGPAKKVIVQRLEAQGVPYIDVGMGIYEVDGRLAGLVRTTVSTEPASVREAARSRISFGHGVVHDIYGQNIQIADLNALNATLAVIAWKKLMGFYSDFEHEHFSAYTIDTNALVNEDQT